VSTEAKFVVVVAAVRKQAADWPHAIEASYGFTSAVAESIGLDFSNPDGVPGVQRAWEKFCNQVYRALNRLADENVLVKGKNGGGTVWRTPAVQAEFDRVAAGASEDERALIERGARLRARLKSLPVPGGWSDYGHTGVVMDLDALEALLDLAEKAEDTF
jgi:hypothetical protein